METSMENVTYYFYGAFPWFIIFQSTVQKNNVLDGILGLTVNVCMPYVDIW